MSNDEIRAVLFIASATAIAGHAIEYRKELRQRGNELAYSWREFLLEREFEPERNFEMDKDVLLVAILAVVLMVMGLHAPLPVTIFSGLLIAVLIWRPGSKQT